MIINVRSRETSKSIYFQDGGYCFLKNDNFSVAIPVIDPGKKHKTGHIHLDAGSLNVSYKGVPFIVDPGTYTYTRDIKIRKKYIDFHSHNVSLIKDIEPQGVELPGFFNVRMENRITGLEYTENSIFYKHSYCGIEQSRSILLKSNSIEIKDRSKINNISYFYVHPGWALMKNDAKVTFQFNSGTMEITVRSNGRVNSEKYDYSEGYGHNTNAIKFIVESNGYHKTMLMVD